MRVLMSRTVWVHYGQIYVESGQVTAEFDSLGGQRNGLCGAAVPGSLFLNTGLHTGEVGFVIEYHDTPPPLDESWEEIVEVSFRPEGAVSLVAWGGQST